MSKSPMTKVGAEKLREQLHELKTVDRPRITAAIAEARAHGDLSENAEYHAAREQQSFMEGRINTIESTLADVQIINVKEINETDKVVFGATVTILNLNSDEEVTYQIVGELEADINIGLVSIASPIARSLIGKQVGDIVDVNAPSGVIEYEIIQVRYI
ncbi:MAG: transcription elongation factor GreA [Gammaproteobacteria bacterium]|nr:transcription elongation factor GreA [Gammaproteobacteria bacterium]